MEWIVSTLIGAKSAYLMDSSSRSRTYALEGTQIRFIDGRWSFGGQIVSRATLPTEGLSLQIWTKNDACLTFTKLDIDIIAGDPGLFFNATAIPGTSKVLYSSERSEDVCVTIGTTL